METGCQFVVFLDIIGMPSSFLINLVFWGRSILANFHEAIPDHNQPNPINNPAQRS
jgi:hypothetical protein